MYSSAEAAAGGTLSAASRSASIIPGTARRPLTPSTSLRSSAVPRSATCERRGNGRETQMGAGWLQLWGEGYRGCVCVAVADTVTAVLHAGQAGCLRPQPALMLPSQQLCLSSCSCRCSRTAGGMKAAAQPQLIPGMEPAGAGALCPNAYTRPATHSRCLPAGSSRGRGLPHQQLQRASRPCRGQRRAMKQLRQVSIGRSQARPTATSFWGHTD